MLRGRAARRRRPGRREFPPSMTMSVCAVELRPGLRRSRGGRQIAGGGDRSPPRPADFLQAHRPHRQRVERLGGGLDAELGVAVRVIPTWYGSRSECGTLPTAAQKRRVIITRRCTPVGPARPRCSSVARPPSRRRPSGRGSRPGWPFPLHASTALRIASRAGTGGAPSGAVTTTDSSRVSACSGELSGETEARSP